MDFCFLQGYFCLAREEVKKYPEKMLRASPGKRSAPFSVYFPWISGKKGFNKKRLARSPGTRVSLVIVLPQLTAVVVLS